ncbi:hypothetical protein [Kitasatospora sp. NE20-6]|uniref:hypothetical protein n=1 Tax=Kitasatospora sp. NE20-6 TaxID=2859066 RepID=UPI0038B3B608
MTTLQTGHRHGRPAAPTASTPAATVRAAKPSAAARPYGGCCRTWASEHISRGSLVVRTIWHEPACKTWGRP